MGLPPPPPLLKTASLVWDGFPNIYGLRDGWKNTRLKKEKGVILMPPFILNAGILFISRQEAVSCIQIVTDKEQDQKGKLGFE